MATLCALSACLPPRREGAQPRHRERNVSPLPLHAFGYASPATAQMIEYRLGDFEARAEALQPCREGSAQVMQPPTRNIGRGVELYLCFRPSAKRRSAFAGEDKRPIRSPR